MRDDIVLRFADLDKQRIQAIIRQLNESPNPHRDELRRLFEAWDCVGRDVGKMMELPAIGDDLRPYIWGKDGLPVWRAVMTPVGTGLRAALDPTHASDGPMASIADFLRFDARLDFVSILVNEYRERISERPCQRCNRYFWKERKTHRKLCGKACLRDARIEAAKEATANKNRGIHRLQIERVRAAMTAWSKLVRPRRTQTWQNWVSAQCPQVQVLTNIKGSQRRVLLPAITKKFITRNKLTF